ncbi:hypothetical protein HKX69_30040 [Streptomyces argyrophyllae]|uniref:Uncharacterized protein n=1 Tax=Streptomyces argyrophylli TaxID=2726118 RepID=A0A6M4PWU9_9ACTN|nr:hypothetical protein [Streptomyces argyrophyllae]QJS13220.1 hypothetical protein HKX69_30040 [Streptomyces argyrophyllae]
MQPHHSDTIIGRPELLAAFLANYSCGHCNSETEVGIDQYGTPHLITHHDDGCPVLSGTLSSAPDVARAAAGAIPSTFRP